MLAGNLIKAWKVGGSGGAAQRFTSTQAPGLLSCVCGEHHDPTIPTRIALIIGSGLANDDFYVGVEHGYELSHLCGINWCYNATHYRLEQDRTNLSRNGCFYGSGQKHGYVHEPRCTLGNMEYLLSPDHLIERIVHFQNKLHEKFIRLCPHCGLEFDDLVDYENHVVTTHRSRNAEPDDDGLFYCPEEKVCYNIVTWKTPLQHISRYRGKPRAHVEAEVKVSPPECAARRRREMRFSATSI